MKADYSSPKVFKYNTAFEDPAIADNLPGTTNASSDPLLLSDRLVISLIADIVYEADVIFPELDSYKLEENSYLNQAQDLLEEISLILEVDIINSRDSSGNNLVMLLITNSSLTTLQNCLLIKALLAMGCNLDHQAANGTTALHLASKRPSNLLILKLLLTLGAATNIQDNNGITPLDTACAIKNTPAIEALEHAQKI